MKNACHQRRVARTDTATLTDQCHPRKIFIGGLSNTTNTQELCDYFGRFGKIIDAVVLRWPDGRSRNFGYVTFTNALASEAALRVSHILDGREVDVKRAVPGTNKLFVGGLPQNATAAELREYFEAFGVVSDVAVMIDPATSRSRGFGFVCYLPGQEGAAAVRTALDQYQNHHIHGKWIEVKDATLPHKLVAQDTREDRSPSPLPNLLAEPGKVGPTATTSAAAVTAEMGLPPGLRDAMTGSKETAGQYADYGISRGAIPYPSSRGALGHPLKWPGSAPVDPELASGAPPWSPVNGLWSSSPCELTDKSDMIGASAALQKSLEELLRLKLSSTHMESADLATPETLVSA